MNNFFNLILPFIMKHPGFFIQPVCLIYKESMMQIFCSLGECTGAFKHIIHAAFFNFSFKLCRINLTRRAVFGHILHKLSPLC